MLLLLLFFFRVLCINLSVRRREAMPTAIYPAPKPSTERHNVDKLSREEKDEEMEEEGEKTSCE